MRIVDVIARVGEMSPYTHFVHTADDLRETAKRLDRMRGLTTEVGGIKGRIARAWYDKEKKALFAEITVGEAEDEPKPNADNRPKANYQAPGLGESRKSLSPGWTTEALGLLGDKPPTKSRRAKRRN